MCQAVCQNDWGVVRNLFESAKIVDVKKHGKDCHQRLTEVSCYFAGIDNKPVIVNVGDSHAKTLGNDLKMMAARLGFGYFQISANNCPLVRNVFGKIHGSINNNCHPPAQAKRLAKIKSIGNAIIILSARYPLYLSNIGFDNQQGGIEDIPPIWLSTNEDGRKSVESTKSLIQSTINELLDTDAQIVLVYPVPEAGWDIPKYVRKQLDGFPAAQKLNGFKSLQITTSFQVYKDRAALSIEMLDAIPDRPNLIRVYPSDILCDSAQGRCFTHDQDSLYYHDDDHLGPAGAKLVVDLIEQQIILRGMTK